jgi:hypothetical protein
MFNYIYSFTTDNINKHYSRVWKSCVQNQVYAQIFLGFKPPKGKKMQIGIWEENRRSPDPTPLSKQIGSLPAFRLLGSHFYPGFKFARAGVSEL